MTKEMEKNTNAFEMTPGMVNSKRSDEKAGLLTRNAVSDGVAGFPVGTLNFTEAATDSSLWTAAGKAGGMPDFSQVFEDLNDTSGDLGEVD